MRSRTIAFLVALAAPAALAAIAPSAVHPAPAAAARSAAPPPRTASDLGREATSSVTVQNTGTEDGTILVVAARHGGGAQPVDRSAPRVAPGGTFHDVLPARDGLPAGDYAARITADRPTAAVARVSWAGGRTVMYRDVEAGTDILLPLLLATYYGQSSHVAIQNTAADRATRITLSATPIGGTRPALHAQYDVPAGSAIEIDLFRDAQLVNFVGTARITSADAPIAVVSFVEMEISVKAAYAVVGVPAERAARTLFLPIVQKKMWADARNEWSTGISVVNPSPEPVHVTATYRGMSAACAGQTVTEGPVTIAGNGSTVLYQPANAALPDRCTGTAVLEADGNILAVVNDSRNLTEQIAAYPALTAADAATTVALPVFERVYGPHRLTTGVTVMNTGAAPASIEVTLFDAEGVRQNTCGAVCRIVVPPLAAATFYPGNSLNAIRVGSRGSGLVTSDQPVVVVATEYSETNTVDAASYTGIPVDVVAPDGPPTAPRERYVPWLAAGEGAGSRAFLPVGWR